ncbi:MAG: isochorismatase family protein [Myxococcota bacterium]|nr:isochorismatase family protein [Myxococcota bacterium]
MIERLLPARAALLVIDIQERLLAAMPTEIAAQTVKNVKILIETATRFELPIVVSQQYPKGLGATVPELEAALPANAHRYDKVEFSAPSSPAFPALQRDQWIVTGMETHVCVYQSVRDLVGNSTVHVVADAVASRTKQNWRTGLDLMTRLGAIMTTTEVCVFDLLERAGTDHFKTLSKAIR